ncbi:hypothetical protein HNP96_001932, partial [Methanococcus maripaludis]|nr:hypothetical protein [Methanococcus maripaludis]MBB6497871.1 hypothetical protein [Methanococcus maripaludis]
MSAEIEEKVLRNLKSHEELSDILKSTL